MRFLRSFMTFFALSGAGMLHGQGILSDLTSVDPTALTAVQAQVTLGFGAGTAAGKGNNTCPQQVGAGECIASVVMTVPVPSGGGTYRFVITSISGSVSFNTNGSTADLPQQCLTFETVINAAAGNTATVVPSCINFTSSQQTSSTATTYFFSQSVHMFTDLAVDFPTFSLFNLKNIGPIYTTGSGVFNIGVQGYLVRTS